jgi:hypothetical protein
MDLSRLGETSSHLDSADLLRLNDFSARTYTLAGEEG